VHLRVAVARERAARQRVRVAVQDVPWPVAVDPLAQGLEPDVRRGAVLRLHGHHHHHEAATGSQTTGGATSATSTRACGGSPISRARCPGTPTSTTPR
jgi:hypothetical protein